MSRSASARLLILGSAVVALGACATAPSGPIPINPTSRYTLQVEPGVDRIALAVHEQGLSASQHAALRDLAHRFAYEGAPAIIVEAPSGGDPIAGEHAWRIKAALEAEGLHPDAVIVQAYPAPNPRAPVLAGFETLQAYVPQCGREWSPFTATGSNQPNTNFGCATTANMAAQIANPRDILRPRDMTPPDGNRRATVFDSYRAGEQTSADQEPLVGQAVAQAVE